MKATILSWNWPLLEMPKAFLYQMAIEKFLAKSEATVFYAKLMDRVVPNATKKKNINKLKSNKVPILHPEDC